MDKALAQALLLLVMLGLASVASTIYLRYTAPNSPQSRAERQMYSDTAASLFYASIYRLVSASTGASYFLYADAAPSGWVCANFFDLYWRAGTICSDMKVQNQTVTRSFTAAYYNYYTVMVYVTEPLNLTFNWWISSNEPTGWIWFGAFLIKGDAFTENGTFDVEVAAPFYWSTDLYGTRNGTFSGLVVPPGYTLMVLVENPPGWFPQISYGFTVKANPNTLSVVMPSNKYAAAIYQGNTHYGPKPGPVATFSVQAAFQGLLQIYYEGILVVQQNTTFRPGQQIVFYPDPAYALGPKTTLLLDQPVQVSVSAGNLTVSYGGTQATVTLDVRLIGGGTSSAWNITLVGCTQICVVAVVPAQTKQ